MHSYGGFLPIDSCGNEYFANINEKYISRLNAARYAIGVICSLHHYEKIWLPIYMCPSVLEYINSSINVELCYYNIDESLYPDLDCVKENECIVVTNYFGQKNGLFYEGMIEKYYNVIFDNSQAFYMMPQMNDGIFYIYSPRKFFGVTDGAYLIGKNVNIQYSLVADYSSERASYLFKSREHGTNDCYQEFIEAENSITKSGLKSMSALTKSLLSNIDYDSIKTKRNNNYKTLHGLLCDINEFNINIDAESPMVYPLLCCDDNLRKRLIEESVFISQWWKAVLESDISNEWERRLSKYLIPLPIDQRYDKSDMENIARIVKECVKL